MRVEVYIKPSCTLCDQAIEVLTQARDRWGFELIECDIYERAEWFSRYRYHIPVVVIEGQEQLRLNFTPAQVETVLARATDAAW
jgi:glutaredoxin